VLQVLLSERYISLCSSTAIVPLSSLISSFVLEKEHREWVQALESAITGEDASSWKVDADLMVSGTVAPWPSLLCQIIWTDGVIFSLVLKVSNVGGYKNPSVVLCVERDSFTTSTVPTIKEGAAYWSNEDAELSNIPYLIVLTGSPADLSIL